MKIDSDCWLGFLADLDAWRKLPGSVREVLLLLTPDELPKSAPEAADWLTEKAWLVFPPSGKAIVAPRHAATLRLVAALGGVDIFAASDDRNALLNRYLKQHFEGSELVPICSGAWFGWHAPTVAHKIGSRAWLEAFLTGQAPRWESRLPGVTRQYFGSPNIMACAQLMLARVKASPTLLSLPELLTAGKADKPETACKALTGLLRYLLVFARLNPETHEPQIGLWPELTARLHRPAAQRPPMLEAVETFHQPYLVDDITVLLTAAATTPPRLKANGCDLFAKDAAELTAAFPPLPDWLLPTLLDPAIRLDHALKVAMAMKFARSATDADTRALQLALLPAGRDWLSLSVTARLENLLATYRSGASKSGEFSAIATIPTHPSWVIGNQRDLLKPAPVVLHSWRNAPARGFVAVAAFLDYLGAAYNPLLTMLPKGESLREFISAGWSMGYLDITPEDTEQRGLELLRALFLRRLVPLGGVRLGRSAEGALLFEMTDIGRCLLGEAKSFKLPEAPLGEILVQPNFEIVFLGANVPAEAELGRFCVRAGHGHGVLFKITREACLFAARTGLTAADALATLARLSAKPLPRNVQSEVTAWFSQTRTVQKRTALLLECPDAETAGRIVSALRDGTRLLNPTTVQLPVLKLSTTQIKRLQKIGVFVDSPSGKRAAK
jgi:hypothetical protein